MMRRFTTTSTRLPPLPRSPFCNNHAMTGPEWRRERARVLTEQRGACAAGCGKPARDVVGRTTGPPHRGYCRRCRLRVGAVARMAKAWATRRARVGLRGGQLGLWGTVSD